MSQSERSQGLMTVAEVAADLGISRSTVYAWIKNGHITSVRYGAERKPGQRGRGGALRIPAQQLERMKAPARDDTPSRDQ